MRIPPGRVGHAHVGRHSADCAGGADGESTGAGLLRWAGASFPGAPGACFAGDGIDQINADERRAALSHRRFDTWRVALPWLVAAARLLPFQVADRGPSEDPKGPALFAAQAPRQRTPQRRRRVFAIAGGQGVEEAGCHGDGEGARGPGPSVVVPAVPSGSPERRSSPRRCGRAIDRAQCVAVEGLGRRPLPRCAGREPRVARDRQSAHRFPPCADRRPAICDRGAL